MLFHKSPLKSACLPIIWGFLLLTTISKTTSPLLCCLLRQHLSVFWVPPFPTWPPGKIWPTCACVFSGSYSLLHASRKTFSNVKVSISSQWTPSCLNSTAPELRPYEVRTQGIGKCKERWVTSSILRMWVGTSGVWIVVFWIIRWWWNLS